MKKRTHSVFEKTTLKKKGPEKKKTNLVIGEKPWYSSEFEMLCNQLPRYVLLLIKDANKYTTIKNQDTWRLAEIRVFSLFSIFSSIF
jgi:hypothetical protein